MKINLYTFSIQQNKTNFTGQSGNFRKRYSKHIENGTLSQTSLGNIRGLAERFTKEGLTYEQALKAARVNLSMFVQKPQTMEKNIRGTVEKLSQFGLTTEKYLEYGTTINPQIFSMAPERIAKNLTDTVKVFKSTGLTEEQYVKSALKSRSLFFTTAQKLRKKVNNITEAINVTRKDVITMFLKQSSIWGVKEKEVIKKYKQLQYIEENKFFDKKQPLPSENDLKNLVLRKSFSNSTDMNYLILLKNKLSTNKQNNICVKGVKANLTEFLLNSKQKTYEFSILDGEFAKDFIKFAKKFSKSVLGKNVFKIKIIYP